MQLANESSQINWTNTFIMKNFPMTTMNFPDENENNTRGLIYIILYYSQQCEALKNWYYVGVITALQIENASSCNCECNSRIQTECKFIISSALLGIACSYDQQIANEWLTARIVEIIKYIVLFALI